MDADPGPRSRGVEAGPGRPEAALPYESRLARGLPRAKELVRRLVAWTAAPLGTLVRVDTREPAIALTFDDGPDPAQTPRVLELLERHGARGTFFMIGERAALCPELVARAAAAGHAVANHSWDHPSFRRLAGARRRDQIRRCAQALGPHGVRLFRPPYGEQSLASLLDARRCGHRVVCWDVVAEDWRDSPAEALVERVMRRLRRGSIVVLHDSLYTTTDERFRDRGPMLEALAAILGRLSGPFRFVTVPELLRLGRPVSWHHYYRLPADYFRRLA